MLCPRPHSFRLWSQDLSVDSWLLPTARTAFPTTVRLGIVWSGPGAEPRLRTECGSRFGGMRECGMANTPIGLGAGVQPVDINTWLKTQPGLGPREPLQHYTGASFCCRLWGARGILRVVVAIRKPTLVVVCYGAVGKSGRGDSKHKGTS